MGGYSAPHSHSGIEDPSIFHATKRQTPRPLKKGGTEDPRGYFFFFGLFAFSRVTPVAYGGSQARGPIGAVAAGLHQSHGNTGSEPRLQPTPQLVATPDP